MGNKRNYLLVKDDIGRAKPTVRQLPKDGFTYGKPDIKDHEDAGIGIY